MAQKNEMNQNLPEGWDGEHVRKIIDFYERNLDRNIHSRRYKKRNDNALIEIPKALLPDVWRLIAAYEKKQAQGR
jgi:hypothetical protein